MKLVNPLGRKPSEVFDNGGATPMACMCSGEKAYATARGTDKCFKCGCSCSSTKYSANNSKKSFWSNFNKTVPNCVRKLFFQKNQENKKYRKNRLRHVNDQKK